MSHKLTLPARVRCRRGNLRLTEVVSIANFSTRVLALTIRWTAFQKNPNGDMKNMSDGSTDV